MKLLKIRTYPDEILNKKASPIKNIDQKIKKLVRNMAHTMYKSNGIGLAAPQVGVSKKILIYNISNNDNLSFHTLINPKITKKRNIIISENEGCLSLPGIIANVRRFGEISVKGKNLSGKTLLIQAQGILSIVLQHEIDHLDGTLFIEHLSYLKKNFYKNNFCKKKIKKCE